MKGTFPKDFSQVATSQGYYPKCHLPKGIFPSGNFLNVQFPKRQLPKSALAAALSSQYVPATALGPISNPCRSGRPPPHCSLRPLRGRYSTFGKLPLGTSLHIWEVATREILTGEVAIGKMSLGVYLTPWQMTLHLYSSMSDWQRNLVTRINSNFPALNFQLKYEGYLRNPWSDKGLKDTVVNGHFTIINGHWDQDIKHLDSLDLKVSHSQRLLGLSLAIISTVSSKNNNLSKNNF